MGKINLTVHLRWLIVVNHKHFLEKISRNIRVLKVARTRRKLISIFLDPKGFDILTFQRSVWGRQVYFAVFWWRAADVFLGLWWKMFSVPRIVMESRGSRHRGDRIYMLLRISTRLCPSENGLLQSLWEKFWIYRMMFKIQTPKINCCRKMRRKNRIYRIIIFATSDYRICSMKWIIAGKCEKNWCWKFLIDINLTLWWLLNISAYISRQFLGWILIFSGSPEMIWISFETLPDLVSGKVRWCPLLHCKYLLQGQAMR